MSLQQTIENIWDNRDLLQNEDSKAAIREVVSKLDLGELRVAEPTEKPCSRTKTFALANESAFYLQRAECHSNGDARRREPCSRHFSWQFRQTYAGGAEKLPRRMDQLNR